MIDDAKFEIYSNLWVIYFVLDEKILSYSVEKNACLTYIYHNFKFAISNVSERNQFIIIIMQIFKRGELFSTHHFPIMDVTQ